MRQINVRIMPQIVEGSVCCKNCKYSYYLYALGEGEVYYVVVRYNFEEKNILVLQPLN